MRDPSQDLSPGRSWPSVRGSMAPAANSNDPIIVQPLGFSAQIDFKVALAKAFKFIH
ncbi:MAG: hypothetical protein ACK4WH_10985 [Phycisphaerales bacterium]